jgi:hypothetical protein
MRYLILFLALLAGCAAKVDPPGDSPGESLADSTAPAPMSIEHQLIKRLDPESDRDSFERFELLRIPGRAEVYAAICDWQADWWGTTCVFEVKDGLIVSLQNLDQTEQSMHRIRCITLDQFPDPLIEAYGKTHMGHGAYYLYRVNGARAELLIRTTAVDFHQDRDVLWGGMLRPLYGDINGNGFSDVTLTGTRVFNEGDHASVSTREWDHQETIRKVFLYDPATEEFNEDPALRLGNRYHD